ncbi:AAA family ATPase [Candidatus Riflebacteria bacterium]
MKLNRTALKILSWAQQYSRTHHKNGLTPLIILLSFVDNRNECIIVLSNHFGIPIPKLRQRILKFSDIQVEFDNEAFLHRTQRLANSASQPFIQAKHIFQKLFQLQDQLMDQVFEPWNLNSSRIGHFIEEETFSNALNNMKIQNANALLQSKVLQSPLVQKNKINIDLPKPPQASPKNPMFKYCRPLNELAIGGKLEDAYHRDREIRQLTEILVRRKKSNPIIVGNFGVGKTCLVEGMAAKIARSDIPGLARDFRIYELQIGSLLANSALRGEFEQKVMEILSYCKEHPNTILFIDDIHTLLLPSATSGMGELATLIKPALARGDLRCIATTSYKDYARCLNRDPGLVRRFEKVKLEELSEEQTMDILVSLKSSMEFHYEVKITERALRLAIDLSKRYISNRALPDKAIDVMDSACAHILVTRPNDDIKIVTEEAVLDVVSDITLIKRSNISKDRETMLATLEAKLREDIVGQDRVIDRISGIIKLNKRHLELNQDRPDGVFLFVGPTGVGKTQLSKCLARILLGDEKKLFRLDMSEYMEKHTVSKLLGSPPGYVDSEKEGILSGYAKENPYSIILLDEMEKAHPDVINIFLQIFDDGRLTDNTGCVVDFANSTFVMTSNIGSKMFFEECKTIGFKEQKDTISKIFKTAPPIEKTIPKIEPLVKKHFSSEFLNRLDEILYFNPLGEDSLRKICRMNIELGKSRFARIGKIVEIDEVVTDKILAEVDSYSQGAREIHRHFERKVFIPLSNYVIENPEDDIIRVDVSEDAISFEKIEEKITEKITEIVILEQ